MPQKLKIILGVLIVVAAFLAIRVGSSFYRSAKTAALISQTVITPVPEENFLTKDSDGDGLSDRDEIIYGTDPYNKDTDGDGYWDGEEVATGYDPLDGNSNPKTGNKSTGSSNITQRAVNLTLASIIGDNGQVDKSLITDEGLNSVVNSTLQQAALSFYIPPISDSDIKVIDDNSPAAIQKYLNSLTPIIEQNIISPNITLNSAVNLGTNGLSKDYPESYTRLYNSLKVLEVPSSWKEIHKSGLTLFLQLSDAFNALTEIDKDPVRASYAIVQVQNSFLRLRILLDQVTTLAKSQNINTQDTILETINSLNAVSGK